MLFRKTLFGALAVASIAAGVVVALKQISDAKKEENPEEPEEKEDEVHFIKIDDEDDLTEDKAEVTFDVSSKSDEVKDVASVYPYLNPDFIEEILGKNDEFNQQYEEDVLVAVVHTAKFTDASTRATFADILENAGYTCEEEGDLVRASRRFFTQSGAIISDILNVANQTLALKGEYEGYEIQ